MYDWVSESSMRIEKNVGRIRFHDHQCYFDHWVVVIGYLYNWNPDAQDHLGPVLAFVINNHLVLPWSMVFKAPNPLLTILNIVPLNRYNRYLFIYYYRFFENQLESRRKKFGTYSRMRRQFKCFFLYRY